MREQGVFNKCLEKNWGGDMGEEGERRNTGYREVGGKGKRRKGRENADKTNR